MALPETTQWVRPCAKLRFEREWSGSHRSSSRAELGETLHLTHRIGRIAPTPCSLAFLVHITNWLSFIAPPLGGSHFVDQ